MAWSPSISTRRCRSCRSRRPPPPSQSRNIGKPRRSWALISCLGATEQETYFGRFKLTYEHPYAASPKQFFRNILDYSANYGRTEGVLSANQMGGSDKTDFDIGKRFFLYNLAGVGYDEVRKIDLRYEIGPGLGYHLLMRSNFVMNVEAGMDYQAQYRSDNTTTKDFFPRLAEDLSWKLNNHLTLTEKLEFSRRSIRRNTAPGSSPP